MNDPEEELEKMTEETLDSMDIDDFVGHLDYCCESIDPEEAFRMLRHELEGEPPDPDQACRLERSDIPAFRQGLNDYADDQVKSREWVTFNNGGSYYPVAKVKEIIADCPTWQFDYSDELKDILDFWL